MMSYMLANQAAEYIAKYDSMGNYLLILFGFIMCINI